MRRARRGLASAARRRCRSATRRPPSSAPGSRAGSSRPPTPRRRSTGRSPVRGRAAPWPERALIELQATGESARVRDDTSRRQLTPPELQVGLALAEGRTTRETAARLFLSPKTVEYHLRHVYDKLEIRSREELRSKLLGRAGL